MYDTVKGSDYIGDQEAIEYMCKTGPEAIYELENMGLPSPASTTVLSTSVRLVVIQVRWRAGCSYRSGRRPYRSRSAAHPLSAKRQEQDHRLLRVVCAGSGEKPGRSRGLVVTAIDMESGEVVFFKAKATVLATGGAGRIYQSTTNAHINTGGGRYGAARRGWGAGHGVLAVPPDRHRRCRGAGD
ncbi:FAD-binding protein [Escherichia coli]